MTIIIKCLSVNPNTPDSAMVRVMVRRADGVSAVSNVIVRDGKLIQTWDWSNQALKAFDLTPSEIVELEAAVVAHLQGNTKHYSAPVSTPVTDPEEIRRLTQQWFLPSEGES